EMLATNHDTPWAISLDDIDFGRACLGETMRARGKATADELDEADLALLRDLLRSALYVHFAVEVLLSRFKLARIVYFGDYSYSLPTQLVAKRRQIPVTHVSHAYNRDIDRRYVSLLPGFSFAWAREQTARWPQFRDIPVDAKVVSKIFDGALFRLFGH